LTVIEFCIFLGSAAKFISEVFPDLTSLSLEKIPGEIKIPILTFDYPANC